MRVMFAKNFTFRKKCAKFIDLFIKKKKQKQMQQHFNVFLICVYY